MNNLSIDEAILEYVREKHKIYVDLFLEPWSMDKHRKAGWRRREEPEWLRKQRADFKSNPTKIVVWMDPYKLYRPFVRGSEPKQISAVYGFSRFSDDELKDGYYRQQSSGANPMQIIGSTYHPWNDEDMSKLIGEWPNQADVLTHPITWIRDKDMQCPRNIDESRNSDRRIKSQIYWNS